MARNLLFFPFLRTLVNCESDPNVVSSAWSGSDHCNDIEYVAKEAQMYKGLVEGFDQAVHCLMLPAIGHSCDVFGRRAGVFIGALSCTIQLFFYAIASSIPDGIIGSPWSSLAFWLILVGNIIQGATGSFAPAVHASIGDLYENEETGSESAYSKVNSRVKSNSSGHAFGILQIGGFLTHGITLFFLTVLILQKDFSSYANTFLLFAVIGVLCNIFIYFNFPETLPPARRPLWSWSQASPFSPFSVLYYKIEPIREFQSLDSDFTEFSNRETPNSRTALEKSNLKWLSWSLLVGMLGLSSLTVLQALMVAQYHYSQTQATLIFAYLAPLGAFSLMVSFYILPKLGALKTLGIGTLPVSLGMFFLCFSTQAEWCLVVGIGLITSSVGTLPAYFQLVTEISSPATIGQYLGNLGAISLAGIAVGNVFHSTVFRTSGIYSLPFITSFPLLVAATYLGSKISI